MNRTMTVEEVAQALRLSKRTVAAYLRAGTLRGVKIGKSWRIREADVEALVTPQDPVREGGC
jgi:excisionase family DNA binding protein